MTPLQVVIAKNIIKERGENSYFGLYMTYHDNEKNKYYYEVLRKECDISFFIQIKNEDFLGKIKTVLNVQKKINIINSMSIECILLANIDLLIVQYVVSRVRFNNLISFDDGVGNIFLNSVYFIQKKQSSSKVLIKKILGIKFKDIYALKKLLSLHYTIYPNEKNIIENVKGISIFSELQKTSSVESYSVKKIILGQPLDEFIGEDNYRGIISKMHKFIHIDYYFPHPRESLRFDDVLTIIDSKLIIEDYLIQELNISNVKFEIYTFFSSSILSLKSSESIDINVVSNTLLMESFSEAYQFFIDRGVNLINLDVLS